MVVNVNLKVTSFGKIVLEMGKSTPPVEANLVVPTQQEKVRYREPLETASQIYEVQYQEGLMNYRVPLTTA